MSFYRVGYSGITTKKKKASVKKKPKWDDTNHDLSAYKATDEEIMQRKLAHKSKNHMAFKLQQIRKGETKCSSNGSNAPVGGRITQQQARQLAIMKEILYDQRQLKNVLDKTDSMMAVVQDLFGDDPKKYKGFPNITTAPNNIAAGDANRTSQLAPDMPEIYTRIEALSDSVMNPSALNDLPDSDSDEDGKSNPHPIVYQPQMNLQRFQQFIANEEKNQTFSSIGGQAQLSHNEVGPVQSTQIQGMSGFETPPKDGNESIGILRSPRSAINDTSKVKKSRNRVPSQSIDTTTQSSAMNLTDMRKVLESLEDEIEEFEKQTGRRPPAEKQRANTFSGYTVALIDAVSKLAKYLRETDRRLQAEITVREQLTQDVHQMRNIIDALTSDIIVSQEEYGKTQTQFERYRQKTEQEFAVIKAALHGMGVQTINVNNSSGEPQTTITPPKHHPDEQFNEMYQYLETFRNNNNLSTVQGPAITSLPNHTTTTTQSLPNPALKSSLPDHLQDHGAVLLSPPVRKTRVHDQQEHNNYQDHSESLFSRRQTSLIDLPALANGVTTASDYMPPVGATINVPRPIPLSKPITSQTVETSQAQYQQVSIQAQDHLPAQVSVSVVRNPVLQGGMPKNPREDDMKSQIAELNKQHEEAQKRLQLLLVQQQQQKLLSDQDKNQQNRLHTQDSQDRSPLNHMSQSMLNQQRQLMQQQQQIAQLLERQSQNFANQSNHNSNGSDRSELSQNKVLQQQENVMQHMQLQMQRMQQQQGSMGFDIHRQMVDDENTAVTPPRDTNTQNGGPFSPEISPISQLSDNLYVPLQNQHPSRQAPRDIQISLPTVDFDSTLGDTPSPLKR